MSSSSDVDRCCTNSITAGALNGGCSAPFTDGEGPHGASTLSVDLPLNENYNPDLGYRTSAAASENTANDFPMFWEPIVNCPYYEGASQMGLEETNYLP